MRKQIFVVLILMIFTFVLCSDSNRIFLKIPIRVYKKGEYLKGLSVKDFTLKINGKVRTIEEILTGERAIGDISEKRNFILQFNLSDYGKNITKGIDFFINEILKKEDNLLLWTPVKIYRIKTDKIKQNIISDIEKIVRTDSFSYKRLKEAAKDRLLSIVRKFDNFSVNGKDSNSRMSNILTFLNDYSREWLDYKSKFLVPDVGKYYDVFSLLSLKYPGEKYFINFQQREIIPSLKKYYGIRKKINDYLSAVAGTSESSYSSSISNAIKKIDRSILLSDNFNTEKFISPFKGANISYNLILFHSFRQTGDEADSVSPDMEGILRNISKSTGGYSISTNDLQDGLNSILKKSDHYYYIIYKFNGKRGKKKIEITTTDNEGELFYKKKFSPEEIDLLIRMASEPGITVSEVKINGQNLSFIISGFSRTGKKMTGIIKVNIKFIDNNMRSLMDKTNTLRADKDSVRISLQINPTIKGFFKLEISAKDLNANKTTTFSKYIEIK